MNASYTIKDALEVFGVNEATLTDAQKKELEDRGYLIINNIIDPSWLWEIRNLFESVFKTEGYLEGRHANAVTLSMGDYIKKQFGVKDEDYEEKGLRKVFNIVNEGTVFDRVYTHPKVLAAVNHLFKKEFKLSSLTAAEAIPGEGQVDLQGENAVRIIWALDDFQQQNGSVRIVPGSHKGATPSSEEVLLTIPAASMCILAPNVQYSITTNNGTTNRRFLLCDFIPRENRQELNQYEYIRVSTYERIIPAARYILDVR
jgi:hypothetical protein